MTQKHIFFCVVEMLVRADILVINIGFNLLLLIFAIDCYVDHNLTRKYKLKEKV